MQKAESHYAAALELYRTTDLSVNEICGRTGVSSGGFRSYLHRHRRDLVLARHGIRVDGPQQAATVRLRKRSGQSTAAHAKYREAILACDDMAYIGLNISRIASLFRLNPTALANQLRNHYPEILRRREEERSRLGVGDNLRRGADPRCREQYAHAVEHLRRTDDTIRHTAELYALSYSGLRAHLLYYCKDVIRERSDRRRRAKTRKVRGALTGSGVRHDPKPSIVEKYRQAVTLYRTTSMTHKEICAATGVTISGLRNHLRLWHKDLVAEHHRVDSRCAASSPSLPSPKRYLKSTAAKYAEAIRALKTAAHPTAEVAKTFGLHPETFRAYVREHEPSLAASLGMTTLSNGRQVLARSAEKYDEAVRLYATTAEPLKSIARRLGLQYNSLGGFVRRNRPDAVAAHNLLVGRDSARH